MYRVRFHLARGKHYQMWQVRVDRQQVYYYDPSTVSLVMHDCVLHNRPALAEKIYAGDHKSVCAWINCRELQVTTPQNVDVFVRNQEIHYNPKTAPFWRNADNQNIDKQKIKQISTLDRRLFTVQH